MNKRTKFFIIALTLFCCIGCAEKDQVPISPDEITKSDFYSQATSQYGFTLDASENDGNITSVSETNLRSDTNSVLIQFNGDIVALHHAPSEQQIMKAQSKDDIHIYPNDITYTAINNGIFFGYAHQGGSNSDFLITYNPYMEEFSLNNEFEIGRWPASNLFSNNVIGALNCVNSESNYNNKTLLFDSNCVLLKNQLEFDYGKNMEKLPKGIAYNPETLNYILVFINEKTGEFGIATFSEAGKLLEHFTLEGLFYPASVGKGQSSDALYVFILPNNNVLIGTHPSAPIDQWFAEVNLNNQNVSILNPKQLESFFSDNNIRAVTSNSGWYILSQINTPTFSFNNNRNKISVYLSNFCPSISISSKYATLWDWEETKENDLFTLFLDTKAIGFTP